MWKSFVLELQGERAEFADERFGPLSAPRSSGEE